MKEPQAPRGAGTGCKVLEWGSPSAGPDDMGMAVSATMYESYLRTSYSFVLRNTL